VPGTLERFTVYEGRYVEQNEVIGWIQGGESFRAPFDGVVVRAYAREGQDVSPIEPVAVIADISNLHIKANIEETDVANIQRGQAVTVTIDALGREQFSGYVAEIGRVTDAEITGNAMFFNTGGTFTKVTQLIPVRIHLTDDAPLAHLIGLNVSVRISLNTQPTEIIIPEQVNSISAGGRVESVERRNVYTTLGNMIERVDVKVGDFVTEGQVLAVLDTGDLELTAAQLRAQLFVTQQNSQIAIQDSRRMLDGASANLANNTNMQILSAESSLVSADLNLAAAQREYNAALQDYNEGNDVQILAAETALRDAGIALETSRTARDNAQLLYDVGGISRNELRGAEDAFTLAQNQYNDAGVNLENATSLGRRSLEQLESALQAANTYHRQAQGLLIAARSAAGQEIDILRGNVTAAEILANTESLEIALLILERQLENAIIRAPMSGVVTDVFASEGAVPMGSLFVIEDTDNLRIITRFREYDIARIEMGMEVSITSDATGNAVYTGVINRINPAATISASVIELEVEVIVTSQDTRLRIGTNTRISIILD
jgi:multidrug resistance efflux pump